MVSVSVLVLLVGGLVLIIVVGVMIAFFLLRKEE
jgi:hypothetical protein